MKAKWCITVLDAELDCHTLHEFPIFIGSSGEADIKLNDSELADIQLQLNGSDKQIEVHNLVETTSMAINGKQKNSTILRATSVVHCLQVGNSAMLVSIGVPAVDVVEEWLGRLNISVRSWYYYANQQQVGPVSDGQLLKAAQDGELKPTDIVWEAKSESKVLAREVAGLFNESVGSSAVDARDQRPMEHYNAPDSQCPYCWHKFAAVDALAIAQHPDLIGDPVLGRFELQRFLPTRFTPDGLAIDAGGVVCPDIACPRCHLRIPDRLLEATPFFLSIVGAPASGKSYYLASSIWTMRNILPRYFDLFFTDIDAQTNEWLNDYEARLFLQTNPDVLQSIVKTELQATHVYKNVTLDGMQVALPLPCMFQINEMGNRNAKAQKRSMVLYDNAGEHFAAGKDTATDPGTQHLAYAQGVMFFFDPSVDARFTPYLETLPHRASTAPLSQRQDTLLIETISRIRRRLGLSHEARYAKPFVFVISKSDLFGRSLDLKPTRYLQGSDGKFAMDSDCVSMYSYWCRHLLLEAAPELVYTVESFADHVVYVPVSSLGHNPVAEGVRPGDIKPLWVDVPLLYILSHYKMIPVSKRDHSAYPTSRVVAVKDGIMHLEVGETGESFEVPCWHAGHLLVSPVSGQTFVVPEV